MTECRSSQAGPGRFDSGVTDVLRAYLRRWIAAALKLRGIAFAQENGSRELHIWHASDNKGILEVNRRLGVVRGPAHIASVKEAWAERPEDAELTLGGGLDDGHGFGQCAQAVLELAKVWRICC